MTIKGDLSVVAVSISHFWLTGTARIFLYILERWSNTSLFYIGKIRVLVTNAEMEEPVWQIQTEATPVLARKASLELDVDKSLGVRLNTFLP